MKDLSGGQVNGVQQAKLLTDIQQRCSEDLKKKAGDMGIDLMDLEVLKCVPVGPIVDEMERLALKNTKIQNTAATIDRENENAVKQQDYEFVLAEKAAATQKARASGDANAAREKASGERDAAIRSAEGKKQSQVLDAEAQKEVLGLQTSAQNQQLVATATAKLEAAKLEAQSIEAIAAAKANAVSLLAAAQDKFGSNALELSKLQQLGENAKTLSEHLSTVVLPSNESGQVNPLLSTVFQATIARDIAKGDK
jgi:regulator of protease activity HflC (stomatin/prohibitin superfamily)